MTKLPLLLSLEYAAQRTGLDIETLREMIEQGKVMAGISPEGALMVAVRDGKVVMLENGLANGQATGNGEAHEPEGDVFELNRRLAAIKREQFKHLEGLSITVQEASRKYGVPAPTIYHWVRRGFIRTLTTGRRKVLNEADVAFCARVWKIRKPFRTFAPLLDEKGNPYLLKRPDLAKARRLVHHNE